jgi:hypothetical protein
MGKKGGETTQSVEIDPRLEEQGIENMKLANMVSRLPLMQNFGGTVAAFTPQQQAGMQASNAAAASLGMPSVDYGGPNTGMGIPGLPQAQDFGGFQGYSTQGLYEDAMSRVPQGTMDLFNSLIYNPQTGAAPTAFSPGGALDPNAQFVAGASPVPGGTSSSSSTSGSSEPDLSLSAWLRDKQEDESYFAWQRRMKAG